MTEVWHFSCITLNDNMEKIRKFKLFYLYVLMNIIYGLYGSIIPIPGVIANASFVVASYISLVFFFKLFSRRNNNQFFKGWTLLCWLFLAYGITHLLFGDSYVTMGRNNGVLVETAIVAPFDYLKYIIPSMFPIYVCYYYKRQGAYDDKLLYYLFLLFLIIALLRFVAIMSTFSATFDITNNAGYFFLLLLPLLFYCPKYKLLFLVIIYTFIFLSMKRGAIFTGVACLPFIIPILIKGRVSRLASIIIMAIGFLIIFLIGDYIYSSSDYLQDRIMATMEGKIGGREEIFETGYNYFLSQPILTLLFGNGADSTVKIMGNYAHNDWLEIAICQGIFGLLAYLFFWIQILTFTFKQESSKDRTSFFLIFLISFLMTIFSQSYTCYTLPLSCLMGSYITKCDLLREKKRIESLNAVKL